MPSVADLEVSAFVGSAGLTAFDAFQTRLPEWFDAARRPMPWRETDLEGKRDPYRVWISEVMLQQTRVETATPYFLRFIDAFPTIEDVAQAPLDDVLKLWEGLGYYSRARNFHRAAQTVTSEHDGVVPSDRDAFRALPGVGPYTEAAVLSLAYGVPLAVLDGNVIRVLSRAFALEDDVRLGPTKKALQRLADDLLDTEQPGRWNESVMELGATICTPKSPACGHCPLAEICQARALGTPEAFPVKSKRAPVPHYTIAVGVIEDDDGRVLIQRRPEDAMLGGLWEFPGGKQEAGEPLEDACARELREELSIEVAVGPPVARVEHAYSHFRITMHAFRCRILEGEPTTETGQPWRWVTLDELEDYAFPRANRHVIDALRDRVRAPRLF
ncbi:A/G-specific adenine glycosylase [Rubrivirga sp.]|uniref:A/G-specific adenine glycosylase n=1 Tax=Rubrivirga sp. TaxID=1885344 RepID=UPI003C732AD5